MKKIIALRGAKKSGKSTVINVLRQVMIDKKYLILQDKKKRGSFDFHFFPEVNGIRVGITTYGNTKDELRVRLIEFLKARCEVIICCTPPKGAIPHLLECIPGFAPEYLEKTVAATTDKEDAANLKDAKILLQKIEAATKELQK